MPIAPNPKRKPSKTPEDERRIDELIAKGGAPAPASAADEDDTTLKPIMLRIPRHIIARIDREAKRLGISRTAYIVQSTVRELDRDERRLR